MHTRLVVLLLGLVLGGASSTFAQSTSGPSAGPGSTTGTGTGTGTPTTPLPLDLDLPLDKPILTAPTPTPAPPEPVPIEDDGDQDDPRDEPPPVIYGEEIDSENDTIVYVIDRSGSMDWDDASFTDIDGNRRTGNRMERAKCELQRSILGLSRNFRFNIIAFDCATFRWRSQMQEANDANKAAAIAWVRGLNPGGATGTGPATALGLEQRDNMSVVLLTDGEPNCGMPNEYDDFNDDAHRRLIRDSNTQRATVTVFGIAASGRYRRFCQNVASDNGGAYFDVP
jgi:hypothetical protein